MKKLIALAACSAFAAAVAGSASAAIVYQSTAALNGGGFYWCSDCGGSGFQALDPFTLGASANVIGVDVVTFNDFGYDGQVPFTVDVYSANDPSSLVFSQSVTPTLASSGVDINGYNYDVVHADLSGLNLTGGTQYWISFFAPTLAIAGGEGGNDGAILWGPPGSENVVTGENLEYALYGPAGSTGVPEPATWAMLLLGLFGLGALLRSQRKSGALVEA